MIAQFPNYSGEVLTFESTNIQDISIHIGSPVIGAGWDAIFIHLTE